MKETTKYGLGFFLALLLLPGILRTAHIFADHQHVFCDHYAESHFHAAAVDCDIFHFQQSPFPAVETFALVLFVPQENISTPKSFFPDTTKTFREKTSTRGPPLV